MIRIEGHVFNQELLTPDSVVIDVGGNNGGFSHRILNDYQCNVICYEPDPTAYNHLKDSIHSNKFVMVNKAVAGHNGQRLFYCASPMNGGNSLFPGSPEFERLSGASTYLIESMSFDDVIQPFPQIDMVKMDCEGSEFEIIRESNIEGFKKIRQLSIEFHDFCFKSFSKKDVEECVEILKYSGFQATCDTFNSPSDYYFFRQDF